MNKLYIVIKSTMSKTFYLMDNKTYYIEDFKNAGIFTIDDIKKMNKMITCKDISKIKLYLKKQILFIVDFNEYVKYLLKRI